MTIKLTFAPALRQAEHIEEDYEKRGVSAKTAKARAWATVNAEYSGGSIAEVGSGCATKR